MVNKKKTPTGNRKRTGQGKGESSNSRTVAAHRFAPSPTSNDVPVPEAARRSRRATRPAGYGSSVPPRVERLSVVTMTVCTPKDFPGALGDNYGSACAALHVSATKSLR